MMRRQDALALAGFVALCLAVAVIAGFATAQSVQSWYPTLNKPDWTPPGWLFGPVWTVLYTMMGVSAWLVWRKGVMARPALLVFFAQLAVNMLWSFLFFYWQSPALGLIDSIAMWVLIVATILMFKPNSRLAAALLLPYLLWVSFATALNAAIVMLN